MFEINYKEKKFVTNYDIEILSDEEYEYLREKYYAKPDFYDVKKEIITINKGGTKNTNITNYYFRDLLDKTTIYPNKWCIEDVFNCKELLSYFWGRTKMNDKIFLPNESERRKLDTAFRIGGMGIASRPSNFPIKTTDYILQNYNVNNNYYDFSCGWGARLTSSLKNNVNYYGTDPNYMLVEKLKHFANDYKETTSKNTNVDIKTQGSEIFVPEWENKIGLAFSSPPYYNLEDYKVGNQSFKEGVTYEQWLQNYIVPTIKNIYKYLIPNGYFLINIKNLKEHNLANDVVDIIKSKGFKLIDIFELKQCKRYKITEGTININENIYVFRKE